MKHILVGTDGSDGAARAVRLAAEIAKCVGGEVLILHVTGAGDLVTEVERIAPQAVGDALDAYAQQILHDARELAVSLGVTDVRTQAAWGDAAEAVLDTVRAEHIDIVVVGRRGRGRLSGLLLGSVSQKLASLAPCVVVIAP